MRFAFYRRVSTEDNQDPQASSITGSSPVPAGHTIVADFFDVGTSRSLPWKRRPRANELLAALKDPRRGFEGVVIGEPQRAFYGNQFGLTFPIFEHYRVQLWVPEVGGAVDPGSDAHELVMALYGGMSKGERNRIKIRVRSAMAAQAAMEGRFLGGRPPYGYRLVDTGPHPNPGKAADGKRLHQLERDPITAPVVQRIYREYLAGAGIYAIAERLTSDGILSPSAADPTRNPHRHVQAWGKSAIRVILTNPRYTGRQVWNKQRKAEILIDVDDIALGHETKMRWNPAQEWVYSTDRAHEALIDEAFERVQTMIAAGARRPGVDRKPRHSKRSYAFSGLLFCGLCDRRMIGSFNNGRNNYRCTYSSEYADAARLAHPRSLYLREDRIVELVDPWVRRAFSPTNLRTTLQAMVDAQIRRRRPAPRHGRPREDHHLPNQTREVPGRTRRRHRPGPRQQWITQVQAEKAVAEAELRRITGRHIMTADEINTLVEAMAGMAAILRKRTPRIKRRSTGNSESSTLTSRASA
jgi:DNA invertase Pin-like site-specific DNA recombinase